MSPRNHRRSARREAPLRHSSHEGIRNFCRIAGPLLIVVGAVFLIGGMASFFSAFGGRSGPPSNFWMCFVGMPLLALGVFLCKVGFMGAAARYVAGEIAPVGKDAVNYMAQGTRDAVRGVAGAIAEGMRDGTAEVEIRCHKCDAHNANDARFCKTCGAAIEKTLLCPDCDELNDPDAKFCDNCGNSLR